MIQRRYSQGCVCCVHMCGAGDKGWDVPGKGMFEDNFRNIMNLGHGSSIKLHPAASGPYRIAA